MGGTFFFLPLREMNRRFLTLAVAAALVFSTSATTRCYKVTGSVTCSLGNLTRTVEIQLLDEDGLFWESDDQMGRTWANKNGQFKVEGCGNDFGPWNDPDPYLLFTHSCKEESDDIEQGPFVRSRMLLPQNHLPHVIKLDEVDLRSLQIVE
ncbi:hypothetical protein L596_029778 [Steinernema carpocapsae]|uniref:Transthyretin/hydroxyisourate hydrolase domain-containing protein n=2 Tax=Steinernema carpocapsae TaxID=34508 RepID=A0A4U5LQT2_STECR|nr:hypothetical protein L596_029778 [Steinernema carpocapsae]